MRKYQVAIILLRDRLHFIYQLQSLFSAYMEFSSYSLEAGIKPYIQLRSRTRPLAGSR